MSATPHAILATLCYLVSERGDVLSTLMHERKAGEFQQGSWLAFGGKNNRGESGEACIQREFKEETGLSLINPVLRGKVYFDNRERVFPEGKMYPDNLVDVFECSNYTGTMKNTLTQVPVWVPNDRLTQLNMPKGDLLILDWMKNSRAYYFSGVIRYKGEYLSQSEVTFYHQGGKVERIVKDYLQT